MVLVHDTSSCHDHLCQIIFKSHYIWLSYGPGTTLEYTNTHTEGKLHFMAGHKNYDGPASPVIHIDFHYNQPTGFGEENLLSFLQKNGHGGHLGHMTYSICIIFVSVLENLLHGIWFQIIQLFLRKKN